MKKKFSKVLGMSLALAMVLALVPAAMLAIIAPQPALAGTLAMTDNVTAVTSNAIAITNSSGVTLESIPSAGSIYIWVFDDDYSDGGAANGKWSQDDFTQESVTVSLEIYRGHYVAGVSTAIATKTYSAVESGTNSDDFRTSAISVATLGVEPGYRLRPVLTDARVYGPDPATGAAGNLGLSTTYQPPYFIRSKVEFDKMTYDIDEAMVITVSDDHQNADTDSDEYIIFTGVTATIDMKGVSPASPSDIRGAVAGQLQETGDDTGIFEYATTPREADGDIWCGDAMEVAYSSSDNTTLGTTLTATAYVSPTSPSSVSFDPATIDPSDASVFIWVIDRDQSADSTAGTAGEAMSGVVTVENVTTGESATVATHAEDATTAGKFKGTLTFGSATFLIHDGDQLKATYTDPTDATDVSTAEAAVGATVYLYDESDVEVTSYTTIQAAVDKVNTLNKDDYTIIVKDSYASSAETWPVDIDSLETGLTIKAETSGKVLSAATGVDLFNVTDTYLTIEGFEFKNTLATAGVNRLIDVVAAANNLAIKDCTFDLTVGYTDDIGINLTTAAPNTVTIDGCTFNVGKRAFGIFNDQIVTTFTVKNSTFTGTGCTVAASGWGIDQDGATATIANFVVQNCTFDSLAKAIDIATGRQTIRWNTIKNSTIATKGAIDCSAGAPFVSIYGNSIQDNTGYSLYVESGSSAANVDLVFNNITGNAKGVNNASGALNATHNWWGTAAAPTDTTGIGTTTTTFYLGAPVELTASYDETAATATFDFKDDTGVEIHSSFNIDPAGAAVYTESPKAALINATFYDAFIDATGIAATDTVTIYFYAPDATADSVAKFWNATAGTWDECTYSDGTKNYGFNAYAEYIWVLAKDQTVTVPTFPTIQQLDGSEFAVVTEVVTLESIAASPTSVSLTAVGDTQQLAITATYSDASTADVTATSTYASDDETVATVSTGGLITAVAVGSATITVTYDTKTTTVAVTVGDILAYYRGLDGDSTDVSTSDLLAAADDWSASVTPPGFTEPLTTTQLLTLADEWVAG